jgi:hypothetical protein
MGRERIVTTDSDHYVFQCVGDDKQVYFIFNLGLFSLSSYSAQVQVVSEPKVLDLSVLWDFEECSPLQYETFPSEHTDLSENFLQLSSVTNTYFEGDPGGKVSQIQQ